MFFEISQQFKSPFTPFLPFADITQREAWNDLDTELKTRAISSGEQFLNFEWPYMSATDFMDFCRTGNRVRYEKKFFSKRYALNMLVLAECIENEGRFYDDIVNGLFSICDELAWNLPAHNTYIRDTPQHLLPDLTDPIIELFSCETAATLATALYLMTPVLDEKYPFLIKRVQYELDRRIFKPYLNRHFWWMGDGESQMCNWTSWCTQNVLIAAFLPTSAVPDETKLEIFRKAAKSTDYFMDEYEEDGCCDEGAGYYHHAGLCLFQILDTLNRITDNAFEALTKDTRIKNIASYIHKVHIHDQYYVNYADCSAITGRCGVREFLFAKMTDQPEMMRFTASDFRAGMPANILSQEEKNLYCLLQHAFNMNELLSLDVSMGYTHPDVFYPSVGLLVVRDDKLVLAAKGGDNADSHNHNDTGSFTIYKHGHPLAIDVGVESYTKKTFSPQRYEIWTMQSAYHNLPTINGYMQLDGEEYCATEVTCDLEARKLEMELKNAYPAECGLSSWKRTTQLLENSEVCVTDVFALEQNNKDAEVLLSIMTYEKPVVCDDQSDSSKIAIGESFGELEVTGASVHSIEEIEITDARLLQTWKHNIYRILLRADIANGKVITRIR